MANKRLQGITIEIDGSTTKLNDALKSTNKVIYSTNSELKSLNSALKLDPKNTELLAQKQELLKKNIQESTNKLNQLKEAQKQMGAYNSLTDEQKENYRALTTEISKSQSAIKQMNDELKKTGSIDLSKIGSTLKKVGNIAGEVVKKVGQVVAGVSTALAGVVTAGVKSYADLEQNVGGVETLFGDSAQKVIKNAQKAYETAGVSANEYMAGVTSFSASLLQSLGNDTSKAADVADMAFRDMSDNANKFGTDMSSIQNAYQGFAKQNYTMLDNLKLGYGGTKTEMERLLADAERFSGIHYDIKNLSDVYNAIHVIQKEMDVTGTTAEEATKTISGSAKAMKSAFNNFLNGSGNPEQLSKTITNFMKNISQAIAELAPNILLGIGTLFETILPEIGMLLVNLVPQLFSVVQNMMAMLFQFIKNNVQPLANLAVNLITSLVNFILKNLSLILDVGIKIILALIQGISDNLPEMIPVVVDTILLMIDTIINNLDKFILVAIDIILALAVGIIDAIPMLLDKIPTIITNIVTALTRPEMLAKLISASLSLIFALGKGLIQAIPELISMVPKLISSLFVAIKKTITETDWLALGKNVLKGILDGMLDFGTVVKDTIKKVGKKITTSIKDFFGIKSPSRLMRDEIGEQLTAGIGVGFEKGIPSLLREVNSAMADLNNGMQASLNPTINPTANSNPLILNIENFNNTRNTDIQQLAEELEFYRKNSALAKGGY